jgi:hypothetical protein
MSPLTTIIATTAIWVFSYPVGVWILGDAYGPRSRRSGRAGSRLAANGASIAIAEGEAAPGKLYRAGGGGRGRPSAANAYKEQASRTHGDEGYTA